MTVGRMARYEIVQCVVTGHQRYGLLVRSEGGETGLVDSVDISDGHDSAIDWPSIGIRLPCVVLGYTRDGRIRVASAPSYVRLIRELDDPGLALEEWKALRESQGSGEMADRFFGSHHARPLLTWALKTHVGSANHTLAVSLLNAAPGELKKELLPSEEF